MEYVSISLFYLIIKLLLLFHGSYYLKFTSSKVKFAKNVPSGAYRKVIQEYKKWKFKWTTKINNGEPALDTMITDTCKCQPINESCHFLPYM
jgi:hypothetical protein